MMSTFVCVTSEYGQPYDEYWEILNEINAERQIDGEKFYEMKWIFSPFYETNFSY